jgi:hypothetical protein
MSRPIPIKWKPKNPEKYKGNVNEIWARSSWERRVMAWFDMSDNIVWWSSEELIIRYYNPIDNKIHRYFPDFIIKVKKKDNTTKTYVLEIKPEYQTKAPVRKRKTQKFINESVTYVINQSKWKAATEFCKDHGWEFKVLTEKDLGIT